MDSPYYDHFVKICFKLRARNRACVNAADGIVQDLRHACGDTTERNPRRVQCVPPEPLNDGERKIGREGQYAISPNGVLRQRLRITITSVATEEPEILDLDVLIRQETKHKETSFVSVTLTSLDGTAVDYSPDSRVKAISDTLMQQIANEVERLLEARLGGSTQ